MTAPADTARIEQLLAQGRPAEALPLAEAVFTRSKSPAAARVLGIILAQVNQDDRAIYFLQTASKAFPGDLHIDSALGAALGRTGRYREALPHIRAITQAHPNNPGALQQLLLLLVELGELDEACSIVVPALQASRTSAERRNLANTLARCGSPARLVQLFARLRAEVGPIAELEHAEMLSWMYLESPTPEETLQAHIRCGQTMAAAFPSDDLPFANTRDADRVLRIGYVSQDLRNRSAGHFAQSLIEGHDRSRFEVWCYHRTMEEDALTRRLKSVSQCWRDVANLDDRAIADQTRADGIDILVDMTGHSGHACLIPFCFRPAPVQVTYMAYPHSTGLPTMDYRIVDALTDPPGTDHATETLIRLDGCFLCYSPPDHAPDVAPPPSAKSPGGGVVFGSFNTSMKLAPRVLALWARVLKAVPSSRLLLKARGLATPERAREVIATFKNAGIDPKRITCRAETATVEDHLRTYSDVDIALDPFPYNGTTTTLEALWMGVPVITLEGNCHRARVGVSLLTNAGLPNLIARDEEHYIKIAADLARDRAALAALRADIRERLARSTICDRSAFIRKVEDAYRRIWQHWCAKN